MSEETISQRAQQLLKLLIERYISEGQPVASKALARSADLSLSPASVRHVMADLEERGFLSSPHTSAGRIPTPQAYRFFVNTLIQVQPLDEHFIAQQFTASKDKQHLLQSTSDLLSGVSQLASIVTLPKRNSLTLRHVEFLSLSERRVLVILVVNNKEVQNRIIYVDREYTSTELTHLANFLTTMFAGRDLADIRAELLESMRKDRQDMDQLMKTVIAVADEALRPPDDESDCLIAGQTHLLDLVNEQGVEPLRALFNAFTEKQTVLQLLDKSLAADGLQIFIGEESGYTAFEHCSLVTAPYSIDGQPVGVLGVIGPTRMSYDKVIPLVDITAKLLSAALN